MLNLPEKPQHQMIVKFLTQTAPKKSFIRLYNKNSVFLGDFMCSSHNLNDHQWEYKSRWVHTCDLTDLTPDTSYSFQVYMLTTSDTITEQRKRKFKTFSREGPIIFASGGDMGINEHGLNTLKVAIQQSPDFIAIGGDIVYDDGFISCFARWYKLYTFFDRYAVTKDGHMIPLLTAIGNHEAQDGLFHSSQHNILPYLYLASHQVGKHPLQRSLYHTHLITEDYSVMALDSSVVNEQKDQLQWMEREWSSEFAKTKKLVLYHSPLYPSSSENADEVVMSGRLHWEPMFSKYNVSLAMENHDHIYKRSKPIRYNQIVEKGTVYIGDGAMGVLYGHAHQSQYHERIESKYHFYVVKCAKDGLYVRAIDDKGVVFDELLQ
jgi:3',5'-cyclic AMP phosphodiesterase CpdA